MTSVSGLGYQLSRICDKRVSTVHTRSEQGDVGWLSWKKSPTAGDWRVAVSERPSI